MSSNSRSRRSAKVKPHAAFAELRELRESGKTRLSTYKVEEEEQLFDEVDDDGYKKIVRDRLLQDDFVVDDGGEGYVDNGMDDWDDEKRRGEGRGGYYDSEEDSEEVDAKGKKLTGKRKREAEEARRKKKEEQEGKIAKYFNNAATSNKPKPKPVAPTVDDQEFMNDLLGDFDKTTSTTTTFSSRRVREEPVRKTRRLTPPMRDTKKKNGWLRDQNTSDAPIKSEIRSSPPPMGGNDEYDDFMPTNYDDDIDMADNVPFPPSSPTIKAVQRKTAALGMDDEDDDEFTIQEIKGVRGIRENKVNISASKPVPKAVAPGASAATIKAAPVDSSAWKNVNAGLNVTATPVNESAPIGKLNPHDALEEDGTLKFFWIDYTEVNGSLCLFGKVLDKERSKYVSCFLKVDGIMRNLYFLPREYRMRGKTVTSEEITMSDVYEEVSNVLDKCRINSWKSKPCSRKYAFELPDIPRESDYLKVLYPYTIPAIDLDAGETFSHVFGTHTALFEQFVLCRKIMGPCWLTIKDADFQALQNSSWCKLEVQVSSPLEIERAGESDSDTPPLTLMSVALRTVLNVKDNKQEIIAISARIYENVTLEDTTAPEKLPCQTFTLVRPIQQVLPPGFQAAVNEHKGNIRIEQSEQGILNVFLAKLQLIDPDVLIGHQLENVDYSVLLHRMKEKKIHAWHRIGRMRRSAWPHNSGRFTGSFYAERGLVAGRLMCDLANDLGKSLMTKCQSWSLTEMCEVLLSEKRTELDNDIALKTWASTGKGYLDYLLHCEADTYYIAAIALKVQMLPLTKQLTNLAGNSWARTMSGTRAERNEYILLHEFYKNKYICPDKWGKKQAVVEKPEVEDNPDDEEAAEVAKKKDKYTGGLVLSPEKGLYDKFILVMDFNSLYPSIIQEFNICFTTVDRANLEGDAIPNVPEESTTGILPRLISNLVNRRREVKKLMKDDKVSDVQKSQWDIKQQALKLTANSMYGCLGYDKSRFYARPLAALTTYKGREILLSTKELAESMQLEVIYGDTDSVMINSNANNYMDALRVGNEFKKAVNERYRLLEIDIDNVFQRLLLHAKKKYAALNLVNINGKLEAKLEVKGLDMRRREYCALSKEASSHILNEIFSGDDTEVVVERIHEYLRELSESIREGKPPLHKYTIFTKLGKEPDSYPNKKTMPHVQVALRKKAQGGAVKVGDVISFIIAGTDGDPTTSAADTNPADRAYAPQDVAKDPNLKPDPEWYLLKQIFPPVERLCGPIEGTDAMRIAECLGLDTRKYQIVNSAGEVERGVHPLESTIPDEERFKDSARLVLKCRKCKESAPFEGLIKSRNRCNAEGIICANAACKIPLSAGSILAQLEHQIRHQTTKYYEGWLVCSDSDCGNRTRQMSVYGKRCLGPHGLGRGCIGKMRYEYSSKMLYNQLLYFQSIFDVDRTKEKVTGAIREEVIALAELNTLRFKVLHEAVNRYLEKCGRQWVSMETIFSFCL